MFLSNVYLFCSIVHLYNVLSWNLNMIDDLNCKFNWFLGKGVMMINTHTHAHIWFDLIWFDSATNFSSWEHKSSDLISCNSRAINGTHFDLSTQSIGNSSFVEVLNWRLEMLLKLKLKSIFNRHRKFKKWFAYSRCGNELCIDYCCCCLLCVCRNHLRVRVHCGQHKSTISLFSFTID